MKKKISLILICVIVCAIFLACEPACEHNYDVWKMRTVATCQTEGLMVRRCLNCGHYDKKVLQKKEHTMIYRGFKENSCIGRNYLAECTDCFEKETVVLENYGNHAYDSSDVCTICNNVYKPTSNDYFAFKELSDGTYGVMIRAVDVLPAHLFIPNSYNGMPVTSIEARAFKDCADLESVTIGSNVLTIGKSAFSGCVNLKNVTISDSVQKISAFAFYNCENLSRVTIGKNVNEIGESAFEGCFRMKHAIFLNHTRWRVEYGISSESISELLDSKRAAVYLSNTHCRRKWYR